MWLPLILILSVSSTHTHAPIYLLKLLRLTEWGQAVMHLSSLKHRIQKIYITNSHNVKRYKSYYYYFKFMNKPFLVGQIVLQAVIQECLRITLLGKCMQVQAHTHTHTQFAPLSLSLLGYFSGHGCLFISCSLAPSHLLSVLLSFSRSNRLWLTYEEKSSWHTELQSAMCEQKKGGYVQ